MSRQDLSLVPVLLKIFGCFSQVSACMCLIRESCIVVTVVLLMLCVFIVNSVFIVFSYY